MKIEINKKQFEKTLEDITKIINPNAALVSLQGMLIDVMENKIILKSSNGNLSIKKEIEVDTDVKVITPGTILVPGKLFKEIIKKQNDIIELSTEGTSLIIRSKDSEATINLLDKEDYPIISFDSMGEDFEIEVTKFKELIDDVRYASAENDKRLILNGVNLRAENGKLIASATNSFRLAYKAINIDSQISFNITVLSNNLKDFLPPSATGVLKISVNDSKIITTHDNTTVVSNLIDGIYPELQKLIPTSFETVVQMNSKVISDLIDKVQVMSTEKKRVTRLKITKENMSLEMKRDEIGETIVNSKEYSLVQGESIVIPFDISFFKETLSKVKGNIRICFNGTAKPFIIQSETKKELIQLVLPHRSY